MSFNAIYENKILAKISGWCQYRGTLFSEEMVIILKIFQPLTAFPAPAKLRFSHNSKPMVRIAVCLIAGS